MSFSNILFLSKISRLNEFAKNKQQQKYPIKTRTAQNDIFANFLHIFVDMLQICNSKIVFNIKRRSDQC